MRRSGDGREERMFDLLILYPLTLAIHTFCKKGKMEHADWKKTPKQNKIILQIKFSFSMALLHVCLMLHPKNSQEDTFSTNVDNLVLPAAGVILPLSQSSFANVIQ